jgi:hypothetical protein
MWKSIYRIADGKGRDHVAMIRIDRNEIEKMEVLMQNILIRYWSNRKSQLEISANKLDALGSRAKPTIISLQPPVNPPRLRHGAVVPLTLVNQCPWCSLGEKAYGLHCHKSRDDCC